MSSEAAIAHVLSAYPSLAPAEALTFLYVCAEDGLSLKALSKRMGEGQSTVARCVAALEQTELDGTGLVALSESVEGELRKTASLSVVGCALKAQIQSELESHT